MTCNRIFQSKAPYSVGKMIKHPEVGTWGYTAGQIGQTTKGELVSDKARD